MSQTPPILAYDDLPPGSAITVRREPGNLLIEIPGERFVPLAWRMLRLPRIWVFYMLLFLIYGTPAFLRAYRTGTSIFAPPYPPMVIMLLIMWIPSVATGLYLGSRRWERIAIDATTLSSTRGGKFRQTKRRFERHLIRGVRINSLAVIVSIERPATSASLRKPRSIWLMNGRDPAELAWVAREIRSFLELDSDTTTQAPSVMVIPVKPASDIV